MQRWRYIVVLKGYTKARDKESYLSSLPEILFLRAENNGFSRFKAKISK
jgi:hypothetical protein